MHYLGRVLCADLEILRGKGRWMTLTDLWFLLCFSRCSISLPPSCTSNMRPRGNVNIAHLSNNSHLFVITLVNYYAALQYQIQNTCILTIKYSMRSCTKSFKILFIRFLHTYLYGKYQSLFVVLVFVKKFFSKILKQSLRLWPHLSPQRIMI